MVICYAMYCVETSHEVQEDDDADSTARVPIVLAGLVCEGTEQSISACFDFSLGRAPTMCRHEADVHLVCSNGPNAGTPP